MTPQQIIERYVRTVPGSVAADVYARNLLNELEQHGYRITNSRPLSATAASINTTLPPEHHLLRSGQWNYVIDGFGLVGILFFIMAVALVAKMRDVELWMGAFAVSVGCFMISVGGFMRLHRYDGEESKVQGQKTRSDQNKLQ